MLRILLIACLCLGGAAPLLAAVGDSARLCVDMVEVKASADGPLRVALFRGRDGWPKFSAALQVQSVPASAKRVRVIFPDLPPAADYAVQVHHDQNGNGKFDMRWFPYPRPEEGVGVSNNHFGFGPPDFSAARFELGPREKQLVIQMHY